MHHIDNTHTTQLNHFADLGKCSTASFKLKVPGSESRCFHSNFWYGVSYEQEVSWYSGNYRVYTHFEIRMRHDNIIRSIASYGYVLTTQLNHPTSLSKWLTVCLLTKGSWVRIMLLSLKLQLLYLFLPRSSLIFRQSWSVHFNLYATWK